MVELEAMTYSYGTLLQYGAFNCNYSCGINKYDAGLNRNM